MGRLSAWALSALMRMLAVLPLSAQRTLGRLVGRIAWLIRRQEAHTALINLAYCFPGLDETARRRLARESFLHTAMLFTETGAIFHWREPRWRRLVMEQSGAELLGGGAGATGVLVLVPHFGNWEFLALVLGDYGVTALYDPPRHRALEPLIRRGRSRAGAVLLPIDAGGLRGFYRALASGGVAALLPDQVPDRAAGVYADFFGHPALTMTLVQRLLRRTGARVVLGAAMRCPGGFRVVFSPLDGALLGHDDPVLAATAMNAAIERLVSSDPAQYQWGYRRFKRQPRGVPSPYAGLRRRR